MAKAIQAIRGMNDLLPEQVAYWQRVERVASEVFAAHGYREIRFPVLEKTELYKRSIGEVTDIVEKEMYTFEDRNGDSLTLRPEGTAGCVRAGIENGLLYNQVQRLWYAGPMFRHERPQKGRYRQFHQIGAEAFGIATPDLDAEMILMTARLWRALGLPMESIRLEINSLGTPEARHAYREALVRYLTSHRASLDEDSLRRLESNPLRVLDSKNPALKEIIQAAPNLLEYLDDESRSHFAQLQAMLGAAGVPAVVNPRLVRGLDYYTRTVFEWITTHLGAQGTICAGGRYDGLVAQLGGQSTPAAGFALGIERLVELLAQGALSPVNVAPQIYLALLDESLQNDATVIAERLRDVGYRVLRHCGGGSHKSQMKKADQSGAPVAVLLARDGGALAIDIKLLRDGGGQERVTAETLAAALAKHIH